MHGWRKDIADAAVGQVQRRCGRSNPTMPFDDET